ncbi:MAG TPA: DEAD/DEAH box helicase [Actinocatenispora sp.]
MGVEVTFLAGGPARTGRFAFWRADGPVPGANDEIVVAVPGARGPRRRRVAARVVGVPEALPDLLDPDGDTASHRAWSAAVLTGLGLVARGRLAPGRTAGGVAAWRALPEPAEADWLRRCAAAMPPEAYAVPVAGAGRILLPSPDTLLSACWDALADTLTRTGEPHAAAEYAGIPVRSADRYAGWLDTVDRELGGRVRLVVRVLPPDEPDGPFAAVLAMRSAADPSLLVELADLWRAPAEVLARFGGDAETDVLLALRRAARVWPALAPALAGTTAESLPLSDDDLDALLGDAGEALAAADVDLLWPAELTERGPRIVGTTRRPAATGPAAFGLDDLLEFEWQGTMDGESLTGDEVAALAEAKRPLIRLRGRWVRVDRSMVARLRARRHRRIGAGEALAAALTGVLSTEDGAVDFRADPVLADLVERIASLPTDVATPPDLAATLRPYQRRGLAWLAGMAGTGLGGCLADDMGLGKTLQVIALHLHRRTLHCGPTLVCCPTSLLGNWEREIQRFAPGTPVRRFHGTARDLGDLAEDEIVLATYGVLRADGARSAASADGSAPAGRSLAARRWGLMVADEAQYAKNPLSRTAKALRSVPAVARVALTGTPVENRLTDLWSIVDWTTPGLLGTLESFRHKVAIPIERYGNADATARLAAVTRPFLLRRRKTDPGIAPELPPKTETDQLVPLTAEQVTLYEAVVRDTMAEIETAQGIARRGLVLKLLTALKQICNHPAQYLGEPGPVAGRSGKVAAVDELLDVILAEGDSVLLFSQYVAMCRLLERHLADRGVPTLLVHGGVPVRQREERVRRFQAGEVPVFLLSLKAAGTGLNLTRASHVVHVDRWWNPAVEDQATDRAYRIGQDRAVQVHRLVTENTVEDRVAKLIADKRKLADAVVGGGETWLADLSDAELADLVALT